MKLSDIETKWAQDASIDGTKLDVEATQIPILHNRYYNIYIREKATLNQLKQKQEQLAHILDQFYKKNLTAEELKEYNLSYPEKRIMNADVPKFVDNHEDNIELKRQIGAQHEKVDFLKSILHQINQRSFQINSAVKFKMFQAGVE